MMGCLNSPPLRLLLSGACSGHCDSASFCLLLSVCCGLLRSVLCSFYTLLLPAGCCVLCAALSVHYSFSALLCVATSVRSKSLFAVQTTTVLFGAVSDLRRLLFRPSDCSTIRPFDCVIIRQECVMGKKGFNDDVTGIDNARISKPITANTERLYDQRWSMWVEYVYQSHRCKPDASPRFL